jgi:hypothetical protein
VHQSARSCDDNIWVQKQTLELVFHIVTTNNQAVGEVGVFGHRFEVNGGLDRELTRWREHDASSTDNCAMSLELLYDWYGEGASLATTSASHRDDIEPLQDDWDCSALNRRWQVVPLLLNGFVEWCTEVVTLEASSS